MKWIAPLTVYSAVAVGLFQFQSAWGALFGFHVAIVGSLLIARPKIPVSILFKNQNYKWILLSTLLCGSSGVMLYLFWKYFGIAPDLSTQLAVLGLNPQTWILFIAYFALTNPFIEEYFWRGYLGSPIKNLHISDFLYAGFHGLILINKVPTWAILFALGTLVIAGWLWRQIQREDEGLLAPVLGHMAADLTILSVIFWNAGKLL